MVSKELEKRSRVIGDSSERLRSVLGRLDGIRENYDREAAGGVLGLHLRRHRQFD